MFGHKNILIITKENLSIVQIKQNKVQARQDFVWTNETFISQLDMLKTKLGSDFRILLDDLYVHTAHIYLPTNNDRSLVREKAQEIIPVDLDQTVWDFKEETELRDDNQKNGRFYQILAIDKQFYVLLSSAISVLKLKVAAIEPVSQALARQLAKKNDEPLFIFYQQSRPCLITCFGDIAIDVNTLETDLNLQVFNQYREKIEQKYGLKPNQIFVPEQQALPEGLEQTGLNTVKYQFQPELALGQKAPLHGEDRSILNLEPRKSPTASGSGNFAKLVKLPIIIGFILLLIAVGFQFIFKKQVNTPTFQSEKPTLPKNAPTKTPTVEKNYTITILNGNGEEGAAGEAETLLKDAGFKVVDLDNADNYDYEQTLIQHKQKVGLNYLNRLKKQLEANYEAVIDDKPLPASTKTDIVIILGK